MVAFRDLVCAMAVGKMTEMGCFEEEFITYGCAYLQEEHIKYLVTGKSQSMEDFIVECALKDIYPTPIKERLDRSLVPTDGREELKQHFKLEMVRDLRRIYNRAFFDAMGVIAVTPANNNAYPLLLEMQDRLEGTYDETLLRLYEDLSRLALRRKVLLKDSYRTIDSWLNEVRRQMADDSVVKEQYSRNFAGYAYETPDGRLKYYVNAQSQVAQEQQRHEIARGSLVTPVLSKTYWFKSESQLMSKRQEFERLLKSAVNEQYMDTLKTINNLPTELEPEIYREQLKMVRDSCSPEAVEAFQSYGRQWGVSAE